MAGKYEKTEQIYEGKAKKLYTIREYKNLLLQEFKDDATAFNAQKKGTILNKGIINCELTNYIFTYLNKKGVKTHLVKQISPTEMVIKRLKIIPIEVVTRNIAAGSLLKKTNLKEGQELSKPIVEFYYKDDSLGDPLINDSHALAMKLASEKEIETLKKAARKINKILKPFFLKRGLKLVDFKLEFGKDKNGKIILGDEITPDTCRLWDAETNEKLDKDRFRFELGNVNEAYAEVRKRITGN
ncbi:MAG: phosphoribosylaminoimidazolesuccinocarboxamide synthase [Chlorobi bacterium]|nr:phosphoribosylaminoimidazolesuccinocarboxamide synthase [Chlorobiota bacterium]MCI0715638.1 phosphoribosylaminoimidazolesuccinocarboxamide synthase [Chlorobiota bacterium]